MPLRRRGRCAAKLLSLCTRDYVAAGRAFGARHRYVIFRHLVPNVLGVVAVNASLKVPTRSTSTRRWYFSSKCIWPRKTSPMAASSPTTRNTGENQ